MTTLQRVNILLPTTQTTLYTAPANARMIVKEITLCNITGVASTVTLVFNGFTMYRAIPIAANETILIKLSTVITQSTIIAGFAGHASAINCHISGVEVLV